MQFKYRIQFAYCECLASRQCIKVIYKNGGKKEDSGNELNNLCLSYLTVIMNAKILIQIYVNKCLFIMIPVAQVFVVSIFFQSIYIVSFIVYMSNLLSHKQNVQVQPKTDI